MDWNRYLHFQQMEMSTNINKTGTDQHTFLPLHQATITLSTAHQVHLKRFLAEACPYAQISNRSGWHVDKLWEIILAAGRLSGCGPCDLSSASRSLLSGHSHCVPLLISRILLFLSKEVWQRWWSTFFNVPTVTLRCVCLI